MHTAVMYIMSLNMNCLVSISSVQQSTASWRVQPLRVCAVTGEGEATTLSERHTAPQFQRRKGACIMVVVCRVTNIHVHACAHVYVHVYDSYMTPLQIFI